MTEQEFAAIKERWANADDPAMVLIDVALGDILVLIRAVEERDAIIHDLQLDGSSLAQRAVRGFAAQAIEEVLVKVEPFRGLGDALNVIRDMVSAIPHAPDPLPPDRVRQENERLREKLRAIKEQAEDYLDTVKTHSSRSLDVVTALGWLRAMANDDEVAK